MNTYIDEDDDADFDEASLAYKEEILAITDAVEEPICTRSVDPDIRAAIEALDRRKKEIKI